ncbi:hypothetical protein VTK26DRAFT_4470 [Humicola hyalothermophila]
MAQDARAVAPEANGDHTSPARSEPRSGTQEPSNDIDSQPILLEPFRGFSETMSEPAEEDHVAYPKLNLPTSETGSANGAKVLDREFSTEPDNSSFHGLDGSENPPSSAQQQDKDNSSQMSDSDSDVSLPSLSELWPTASASESKSPSKDVVMSAIKARKPDVAPDLEYEEAMRRLEDSDDLSDDKVDGNNEKSQQQHDSKLAQRLVDKPIEKSFPKKNAKQNGSAKPPTSTITTIAIKTERTSPTPQPHTSSFRRATKRTTAAASPSGSQPSTIPEGSQVDSLLTSSSEPPEENYAEDSLDETYHDDEQEEDDDDDDDDDKLPKSRSNDSNNKNSSSSSSSTVPTGGGWVAKKKPAPTTSISSFDRRGATMPTPPAASKRGAGSLSQGQGKQQHELLPESVERRSGSAALSSLLRAKKKALGRNMF